MWEALKEIFANPWFWVTLGGVYLFAFGLARPLVKRIPILNNRRTGLLVAVIGLLVTSGIFGGMGVGSVARDDIAGSYISDLQITTDFASNSSCTVSANNNVDDLVDVRCTDAQVLEADFSEVGTGVVTVYRTGELEPMSCKVKASTQELYESEKTPGDGSLYTITEKSTLDELHVFLEGATTSTAATINSPKEETTIEFAEGVSKAYLGVAIEVDEGGHDQLNQYSYKDVNINICGKPLVMRIHRMD